MTQPRCADQLRDALAAALYAASEAHNVVEFQRAAIERVNAADVEAFARLCANLPLWEGAARDADVAVEQAIMQILRKYQLAPNVEAVARVQLRADPYVGIAA